MQDGKDSLGKFLPSNRFWEARSSHGPNPKFKDADQLWSACLEYFEWVEKNPLYEARTFAYRGSVTTEFVPKMRAMSGKGLCNFLGIVTSTWAHWRSERADLSEVIAQVEQIMFSQKFEGASADLLNANIIARDLGLSDKKDHTSSDGSMTPKDPVPAPTQEEIAEVVALAVARAKNGRNGSEGSE